MTEDIAPAREDDRLGAHHEPRRDPKLLRFARNDGDATLKSLADLAAAGLIAPERAQALRLVEERYSVAVTAEMAALIDRNDPDDPIAKQFLPDPRELVAGAEERADPIGDDAHSPLPGLVHRYPDRVLLKLLAACPVYCRFCFRRESVGAGKSPGLSEQELEAALAYVGERPQIFEVILTGGDPLVLSARRLLALSERLARIAHVRVLRVHTRAPIAAPRLATQDRLDALKASGKAVYMVLHVNHSRELTREALEAVERIRKAGISTLAQTVLLSGVNADADALERLMRDLVAAQIQPYYLHHPDLAPGTGHFRLRIDDGRRIYAELARRLSGVALPAYVLDIPGGHGKVPVPHSHVERGEDGAWRAVDRSGRAHSYRDEE